MNSISAFVLALFLGGVAMPVGMLAVIADIDGAGKAHAYKVQQAEKQGADRIMGKISVIRWKQGEF
jgi:hypothetical protein